MTWTDLPNPRPRDVPGTFDAIAWPDGGRVALESRAEAPSALAQVLATRSSRRDFGGPVAAEALAILLTSCCKTRRTEIGPFGFPLEFRPYPSAGALHPIHLLVQIKPGQPWQRYDATGHLLIEVAGSEPLADAARIAAGELIPAGDATLFGFAAEIGRATVKYSGAESLVWRDAGVLLGYLSLCSEALGLAFCPLGITGDPHLGALDERGRLRGVGVALVGLQKA